MEALTPREIQTRIRSGQSVEDVVKIAGASAGRVETFAAPVLAEREHIAALALASPVRRAGEPGSARRLRQVVAERLLGRGLDIDAVEWDAWRRSDGRWIAEARFDSVGDRHVARFLFDSQAKFSVAEDDEARWMIGETAPRRATDLHDQRADGTEPTVDLSPPTPPPAPSPAPAPGVDGPGSPIESDPGPAWLSWPRPSHLVSPSDWLDLPPALPVPVVADGVEDTLEPGHRSSLDELYDMISVIEEDSVKIYRGLREPLPDGDALQAAPSTGPAVEASDKVVPLALPSKRRPTKRARASVPSWDEIMFGTPPSAS